jgi:hypothetical protein
VGDEHEREPDAVVLEVAEGQVAQSGVLVVAVWSSTRARARWRCSMRAMSASVSSVRIA